jgi:hypothetical protein
MADDLGLGLTRDMFTGGLDTFTIVMMIIIVIGLIGFMVWFFWFKAQFKHNITIRLKTKGETDIIYFDKYRYAKKRGQPEKIQLWKSKSFKPLPPPEAIDIMSNGKEYCEGWMIETGEIMFAAADIQNIAYMTQENKIHADIKFESTFDEKDKDFYSAQYFEDAARYSNKDIMKWLSENAGIIALLILGILVIAFWNDIAKTTGQVAGSNAEISKNNALMIQSLEALLRDRQYINYLNQSGRLGGLNTQPKPIPD